MTDKYSKFALWKQVLVALLFGAIAGYLLGEKARNLSYLGLLFLNMIKMVTLPMIMFTIIYGITSIEDSENLYRISYKALGLFLLTSIIAVAIGICTTLLLKPGINLSSSVLNQFQGSSSLPKIGDISGISLLIDLIPSNLFQSFVEGNILQIIVFAFFIGGILQSKKSECTQLINVLQQIALVFFKFMQIIMKFAPLGVFGYIASIVGTEGVMILVSLGRLVCTIMFACIIHYIVLGVLILLLAKISPMPFYRKIFGIQIMAFSTSSSKATLVPLMEISENKMGISRQKSRFLLPLSAALNMDGGAIYQSSCAIFFAQMMGIDLSLVQYITLFLMCTLASIGGAGIPGGVLLFLGMVLSSVHLPIEGVLLIATVDRILDMMTTVINVTGCACATVIIDKSEGTLDVQQYSKY